MKIHIGMPTYEGVKPEVVQNLLAFDIKMQQQKTEIAFQFPQGSWLSYSRNLIVKTALANNADWILMWDSDIEVKDPGFFEKCVELAYKENTPVVVVPCALKVGAHQLSNCAVKISGKYVNFTFEGLKDRSGIAHHEIDVGGTGLMLINCKWLKEKWPEGPWFFFTETKTGTWPEDWNFCEEIKKRKGRIVAILGIKTTHWGKYGYEI